MGHFGRKMAFWFNWSGVGPGHVYTLKAPRAFLLCSHPRSEAQLCPHQLCDLRHFTYLHLSFFLSQKALGSQLLSLISRTLSSSNNLGSTSWWWPLKLPPKSLPSAANWGVMPLMGGIQDWKGWVTGGWIMTSPRSWYDLSSFQRWPSRKASVSYHLEWYISGKNFTLFL